MSLGPASCPHGLRPKLLTRPDLSRRERKGVSGTVALAPPNTHAAPPPHPRIHTHTDTPSRSAPPPQLAAPRSAVGSHCDKRSPRSHVVLWGTSVPRTCGGLSAWPRCPDINRFTSGFTCSWFSDKYTLFSSIDALSLQPAGGSLLPTPGLDQVGSGEPWVPCPCGSGRSWPLGLGPQRRVVTGGSSRVCWGQNVCAELHSQGTGQRRAQGNSEP